MRVVLSNADRCRQESCIVRRRQMQAMVPRPWCGGEDYVRRQELCCQTQIDAGNSLLNFVIDWSKAVGDRWYSRLDRKQLETTGIVDVLRSCKEKLELN